MVKDISNENIKYEFGHISLSVDDLISILEAKGCVEVRAKNKSFEFENLDDIKLNKSLLVGSPTIYLEKATINFGQTSNDVSPSYKSNDLSFSQSLVEDLKTRLNFIDRYCQWKIFELKYLIPFCLIGFFGENFLKKMSADQSYITTLILFDLVCSAAVVIKFAWEGYSIFFRKSIYYKPTEGFFKRNLDTIVVAGLTGLVCLIIGTVYSKILAMLGFS